MTLDSFDISTQQERLWQIEPHAGPQARVADCVVTIEGRLDQARLSRAVHDTVAAHEALRTHVRQQPGTRRLVQTIAPAWTGAVQIVDANVPVIRARARAAIDPTEGPVFLATLTGGDGRTPRHLVLTASAFCADAEGLRRTAREIAERYTRIAPAGSRVEPLQYADYAGFQRDFVESGAAAGGARFWRRAIVNVERLPEHLFDPRAMPRTDASSARGHYASSSSSIPGAIATALGRVAATWAVPPQEVLLAAWQTTIGRLTGRDRFIVGCRHTACGDDGLADAIGAFGRYLPRVADRVSSAHVRDLALANAEQAHDADRWHESFTWTDPSIDAHGALGGYFPICFSATDSASTWAGDGVAFEVGESESIIDRAALELCCQRTASGLLTRIVYDDRTYAKGDADRLLAVYTRVLEQIADEPARYVGDVDLLPADDRARLHECTGPNTLVEPRMSIVELFEARAERDPAGLAVLGEGDAWSCGALNEWANRLSHALRRLGAGPDVPVGIGLSRGPALAGAILGVMKAGAAYVPLDASWPEARVSGVLADSGARIVVTERAWRERLPGIGLEAVFIDDDYTAARLSAESSANPGDAAGLGALAYVIYTSGSTGRPKGVAITHGQLAAYVVAVTRRLALDPGWHYAWVSTAAADLGHTVLYPALCANGILDVVGDETARDARRLRAYLAAHAIDVLKITPSHWAAVVADGNASTVFPRRHLVLGGEALRGTWIEAWRRQAPEGLRIWNHYGPTECTVGVAACEAYSSAPAPDVVPLGTPLDHARLYVTDATGVQQPLGAAGELWIGGAGVARGYWGRPRLTAERFVPDPFGSAAGGRVYRTGDQARWLPDGKVEFLGRTDAQVKLRGYRIELGEIEAVLEQCPGVQQCAVTMREDTPGAARLVAYLVGTADATAVRAFARNQLPDYMAPAAYVALAQLPLTPNGKRDRRALPPPADVADAVAAVAPMTPAEELVADIWATVLGRARVGVTDDFFALGGHSLVATQVVSRLRAAFGIELPLRVLFEQPTVRGVAAVLTAARQARQTHAGEGPVADEPPPIVPAPRGRLLPLSFAQQRLWFLDQLTPGRATYNLPFALRLSGPLDLPALRRSLGDLVARHESLRTTFPSIDGHPGQQIHPPAAVPLPLVDLQAVPAVSRDRLAAVQASAEARRPCDLRAGPLLRATVLRLDSATHVLLVTIHHIVADGWSMGILTRELTALYEARRTRTPASLPPLPVQYADFAVWQRGWLRDAVLDRQLSYWRTQLAGVTPLELPTDFPRPAVASGRGASVPFTLTPELTEAVRTLSQAEGVTVFMTLLAAFQIVLQRYTGQDDVAVGTDVANRHHSAVEPLIGFFVNQVILRTDLTGSLTVRALLHRVRQVTLDAAAHQDVPFEQIVELLSPARSLSRAPLCQVKFVLQHAASPAGSGPLSVSELQGSAHSARFEMTVAVTVAPASIAGHVEFATDLFTPETVTRLVAHLATVLTQMTAGPEQEIAALTLLDADERAHVLAAAQATGADDATAAGDVAARFEAQAAARPDAIAVVSGDTAWTFATLNARANQIAHHLRALGVGPEARVALGVERGLRMVASVLGIIKAGGAYLPLDPAYPASRLSYMLSDSQAGVLVTDAREAATWPSSGATVVCLDSEAAAIAAAPTTNPVRTTTPSQAVYIIYTSGSTGLPKGAVLTDAGLANLTLARRGLGVTPGTRVLQFSSPSFDASVFEWAITLVAGGCLVMAPPESLRPGSSLTSLLTRHAVEMVTLPPSALQILDPADVPTVRTIVSAGEACPPAVVARWADAVRLINGYGPTETTACATMTSPLTAPGSHEPGAMPPPPPIGRPNAGVQTYVLDPAGAPVPFGVPGELWIGGVGVGRGYVGQPRNTAARFTPDPFGAEPGARLYRTGDRVRWRADGQLDFLGRSDHQIKLRGYRIELGEIDAVLMQAPGVQGCAVIVRDDGPAGPQLVAYVAGDVDVALLRRHVAAHVPDYMVPGVFQVLPALPRLPNGKLDRQALPAPSLDEPGAHEGQARDTIEAHLIGLWEEILNVRGIGVHDNFFAIGGHSLNAVVLTSRLTAAYAVNIPLELVFERPTIAALGEYLRQEVALGPRSCVIPIKARGERPPLFCVHPAGGLVHSFIDLARHLDRDQPVYAFQARGLEDDEPPIGTLPEMARVYVEAMRALVPYGPYYLAGLSLGAMVAYEMAQQLTAAGEVVALLALLDGKYLPSEQGRDASTMPPHIRDWEQTYVADELIGQWQLDPDEVHALEPRQRLEIFLTHEKRLGRVPADVTPEQYERLLRVMATNIRALYAYSPAPYPGRVTLFRTDVPAGLDDAFGWGALARDGVEVHAFTGEHGAFLAPSQVRQFAARVQAALNESSEQIPVHQTA